MAQTTIIPQDSSPDSSLALLWNGYTFISERCRRHGTDVFETRLLLRPAICTLGEEASRVFYEPGRFTRRDAMPVTVLKLLQDRGSVQMLDGEEHRQRKEMFMSLMTPESINRLGDIVDEQWRADIARWRSLDRVVLFHEVEGTLCRAACRWAGVPLSEEEARQRTREFSAMLDGAGSVGPRNWWGMLLRERTERWSKAIVDKVRRGEIDVTPGSALDAVIRHREPNGELLDRDVAAIELINVLRPVVAVARFVTFAALALHEHPESAQRVRIDDDYLEMFVQEVRRFYPFFPFIAGRVLQPFDWRGCHFSEGTWMVLDLYGTNHDPRIWEEPESFQPERFGQWDGSAFNFVPQGGGDDYLGHRCPGEGITIEVMKRAVRLLTMAMRYDVSGQDLRVNLSRFPAIPNSRFVIAGIKPVG